MRLLAVLLAVLVWASPALAERAHVGYPSSIAALGDSDSTGYDSAIVNRDSRENSWSSGSNPAVQSHYVRILAANPKIKSHNDNFAVDGSGTVDLIRQARLAANEHAEYVTIETGGNDICQPGKPMPLATFKANYVKALRVLAAGVPNARIFVTSDPWANPALDAVFGPYQVAHGYVSDGSTCDPDFDAKGVPDPAREAAFTRLEDTYQAAVASACRQFIHCRFDGGVLRSLVPVMTDFSYLTATDPYAYTHPSIQGHAKMAGASWPATFDFTDAAAPVSHAARAGRKVTLTATDNKGIAGIEYWLKATGAWTRYAGPLKLARRTTLTWRAVDVNGNCEATHSLKG